MHTRPNSQDDCVVQEVLERNCYELPDDLTGLRIVDVGAHIGSFAKACQDRGATDITCYEPEPENFSLLIYNTRKALTNTLLRICAIAPAKAIGNGCVKFRRPHKNEDGYLFTACGGIGGDATVAAITLDDEIQRHGPIDLLKLDIEGAEFEVLAECQNLDKVNEIVLEVHDCDLGNHHTLAKLLEDRGFTTRCKKDAYWGSENLWTLWGSRAASKRISRVTRKLDILVAQFSYGGNGGFQSEHPDVGRYLTRLALAAQQDDRIGRFDVEEFADTPITMCRNRAAKIALRDGFDCLLMIDSDMKPDCEIGFDPYAKPFFKAAFNYLYDRWEFGPVCIGAPYCGPPPINNCYVFHWTNDANADQSVNFNAKIEAYSRHQAELMGGIQACAALPTGLILFDTRLFKVCPPKPGRGWFYYEWTDDEASEKASTEDVTATRDIGFHGHLELGYNPVLCAWDSWAGHHKPLCVRKPRSLSLDSINETYVAAVRRGTNSSDRLLQMDFSKNGHAKAVAHA